MTKQNVFVFAALIALVAAPAFGQCQTAAKDKGACCGTCDGKAQQVKAKTCADKCATACSSKVKQVANKDGSSCCGTCGGKAHAAKQCSDKDAAACAKACASKVQQVADKSCATACSKDGKKDACGDTNCAGDQVRYKGHGIPRMVYQVGDQRLTCPKSSVALAKEKGAEIKYVVAGEVMDDKAKAMEAHRVQLEKAYDAMLAVNYCVDGKTVGCDKTAAAMAKECNKPMGYGVASHSFECKDSAEKAAKQAREAGDKVQMVMLVGEQKFDCPHHAADAAKKANAKVKYCVGEMDTTSETMAKIQLTIERIKVAIDEIEKSGGKQIVSNS